MKKILLIPLLLLLIQGISYAKNGKSGLDKMSLSVLYVGYDPAKAKPEHINYYSTSAAAINEAWKTRMADFKAFLLIRFSKVEVVDVRDYNAAMSDKVDVTIMDAGPVKLPVGFNRPMILMHEMAPNVGMPIGLKFDWYCQCLEDDALNIKTSHPIFNTPVRVKLTLVTRSTPGSFYNGFQGAKTPKEMPMWKVVKDDPTSKDKYIIGMVAHGEGFNDSPDAESISGGVCLKNAEAVALGRHGNYFMWGFSASPNHMTDEAKDVFVNAVCYIKKFDHQPPIMKKVQIENREWVDEMLYRTDKDLYNKALIARKEGNARLLKMQEELRSRKAKGEDIGRGNEGLLHMPVTNDVESFADYLKDWTGSDMVAKFDTNTNAYHRYYRDNLEYFYPADPYSLQVDADAQKLGISNRKVELLEKCIQLWEKGQDTALAKRVLERYTTAKFATAAEWKTWLTKNKPNLYYTESGGFKFMVNTYKTATTAIKPTNSTNVKLVNVAVPTLADPVVISAQIVAGDVGKKNVEIDAAILKGWHIYAYVPQDSPFIVTQPSIELPEGVKSSEWQSSAGTPLIGGEGMFVWENKASFKTAVDASALKPGMVIRCSLFYQVCDNNKCFPPKKKIVVVTVI
ncbi:protein-disulfide reductase DsbD domain-containing protein [Mucilaginibacter sp. OK283]|uniref:protein-disulfide reductase DsbD domain-containing protein n=1 Tax=Mucilaginibacter sp. OK283 TaxID=1881049 RepID=UPI0008D108F9|nr:protein-disulfide reductase DsbD domain-containing protein [Mucilaginibacter sp. OK283]SEP41484.1 Disulphide bond corrector protein DsbC [Mucilaginibacter sp. OK283]